MSHECLPQNSYAFVLSNNFPIQGQEGDQEIHQTKFFVFIVKQLIMLNEWESALSSYVVNSERAEQKYLIIDKLGRGSFGYVLLAVEKTPAPDDNFEK